MKLNRNGLKVKWQCCTVTNRIGEGVTAHIPGTILFSTKCGKGVLVHTIDRSTCQAEEECIRKGQTHLFTEVAFLSSVCFVDHNDDVVTSIKFAADFTKLKDGSDEYFTHIATEEGKQFFLRGCTCKIRNVGSVERGSNLCLKVNAVVHNNHCRILEFWNHTQLLSCKHHQQRLSGTLEMPDQAFFGIPGHNTVDDHICTFKLLIAADDFVFAILFVRCKHGEELEDVHYLFGRNHIFDADLHIGKAALSFVGCCMPRAPHVNGHVNRTVSIAFPFGSEVEHIRYEHSRDAFLVSGDVTGSVQPCDCAADGSLKLTNGNRETIDKENNIESLSTFGLRVYPLICDDVFV